MRMYNIIQDLIPGLPQTPYRHGVGQYEGVVSHCTDSSNRSGGDTPKRERDYEAETYNHAFVHFFVGVENGNQPVIRQVADTNYIAYGAGPYANKRFVHVELCMYDDPQLFAMAYDAYCFILAKILYDRKLGVTPAQADGSGTLWAHADVTRILGGTTHEDPIAYLKQHGISWDQHVANVKAYYDWLAGQNQTANTQTATQLQNNQILLKRGSTGELVKKLQKRLGITVDGIFGPQTEQAVKSFQRVHGLVVDGIVGQKTWDALFLKQYCVTVDGKAVLESVDVEKVASAVKDALKKGAKEVLIKPQN